MKFRKLLSLLLAFSLLCFTFPILPGMTMTVNAAAGDEIASLINAIGTNHGGTGTLSAANNNGTVTVTGTVTGATIPININLDNGVYNANIIWQASYSGTIAQTSSVGGLYSVSSEADRAVSSLINIQSQTDSNNTFTITSGTISNSGNGLAVHNMGNSNATIVLDGGSITSNGIGIYSGGAVQVKSGTITTFSTSISNTTSLEITGGTLTSNGGSVVNASGTISVSGSPTLSAEAGGNAIETTGATTVTLNGGTLSATSSNGNAYAVNKQSGSTTLYLGDCTINATVTDDSTREAAGVTRFSPVIVTGNPVITATNQNNTEKAYTTLNVDDITINAGATLVNNSGQRLEVWKITNNGTLVNNGTIEPQTDAGSDRLINNGVIKNSGTISFPSNQISGSGAILDSTNKVYVGTQTGSLTYGTASSVTYTVETMDIDNGSYPVSVANLPSNVSIGNSGNITITDGSGILTLSVAATAAAGTTDTLTLTIDGQTSAAFSLAINNVSATFDSLTANGASGTADTTELTITLSSDIDLTGDDVTVSGATEGTLTDNNNGTYTLAISNITVANGGDVTVTLSKSGYTFTPSSLTVAVNKDIRTALAGSVSIILDNAQGSLRANFTGISNESSESNLSYAWSVASLGSVGSNSVELGANSSYLGKVITLTVTDSERSGSLSAAITFYQVTVTPSGNESLDVAEINIPYGKVGDDISITYIINGTTTESNTLTYSGATTLPSPITAAPGTIASGDSEYTIVAADDTDGDGVIALTATFEYAVIVNALAPTISVHPQGASYTQNEAATALSVSASSNDSGTLSYQWYSNSADNNTTGTPIALATSSAYTPPTTATGTIYYYCIVTNYKDVSGSDTATAASNTAAIVVTAAPSITSVSVSPASTSVNLGETANFTATVVVVGGAAETVSWDVTGEYSASTIISDTGVLTVASDETASTLTVIATSTYDGLKSGTATVTVGVAAPTTYSVTINGTLLGNYEENALVSITATAPNPGYRFDGWTVTSSNAMLGDATALSTSFTMPAGAVTLSYGYQAITYYVYVTGGTASPISGIIGTTITVTATVPSGQEFASWTVNSGGISLANTAIAQFTMPANDVSITANFSTPYTPPSDPPYNPPSYPSYTPSYTPPAPAPTPAPPAPENPYVLPSMDVTETVEGTEFTTASGVTSTVQETPEGVKVEAGVNESGSINSQATAAAVSEAAQIARENGETSVTIQIPEGATGLSKNTVQKLVEAADGMDITLELTAIVDGEVVGGVTLPLTSETGQILTGLHFDTKRTEQIENYVTNKWDTDVLGSFETAQKGGWGATATLSIGLDKLGFSADDGTKLYALIYDTKAKKWYQVAAVIEDGNVVINTKRTGIVTIVTDSVK